MKRALCIMITLSVAFLCACDFNAPLRKKMVDYYSKRENYSRLKGNVVSVKVKDDVQEISIEIDILTPEHDFPLNPKTNYCEFVIVNYAEEEKSISVGDEIEFSSAPMHFYNGHDLPVVSLEVGDVEIMTFDEGQARYLSWIEQTFD